jgi:simple sugar transport system ATP-binding protein
LASSARIVVIFNGRFVYEARASEADPLGIGRHMAGHDAVAAK